MKPIIFLTTIALVIVANIFATTSSANDRWRTVRNLEFKFHYLYPADWSEGRITVSNIRSVVTSGTIRNHGNCNVLVAEKPSPYTRNELKADLESRPFTIDDWKNTLGPTMIDLTILARKKAKLGKWPAQEALMEYRLDSPKGEMLFYRTITVLTVTPGRFWQLSCIAAGQSFPQARAAFDYQANTFRKIINSFEFDWVI